MKLFRRNRSLMTGLQLVVLSIALAGHGANAEQQATRKTSTSEGLVSQGGAAANGGATTHEYASLVLTGERGKTAHITKQHEVTASGAPALNSFFWFYTADVELFIDRDLDGYFTGIDLLFDADTYYDVADVYAVLYLSYEYGPWNEYAETEVFTIFGSSAGDEYVVETDLVEGYPTGNYDILIELYDAYDNTLVATFGPEDTSELAILPLEDIGRDTPAGTTQIVVNSGGGGSPSWLLLGLLGAGALRRKAQLSAEG